MSISVKKMKVCMKATEYKVAEAIIATFAIRITAKEVLTKRIGKAA